MVADSFSALLVNGISLTTVSLFSDFVTFGARHLTFWNFDPDGEPVLAKKDASLGEVVQRQVRFNSISIQF